MKYKHLLLLFFAVCFYKTHIISMEDTWQVQVKEFIEEYNALLIIHIEKNHVYCSYDEKLFLPGFWDIIKLPNNVVYNVTLKKEFLDNIGSLAEKVHSLCFPKNFLLNSAKLFNDLKGFKNLKVLKIGFYCINEDKKGEKKCVIIDVSCLPVSIEELYITEPIYDDEIIRETIRKTKISSTWEGLLPLAWDLRNLNNLKKLSFL